MLHAIPRLDVDRIQSAQVIVSLSNATKELVENSIDADSSKITIKFTNYGLDTLEVIDNGVGIDEKDFDTLVAKHATSKLSEFADLETLTTLGFRGEALSSLCALSNLYVTTCTQKTYPLGFQLEFNHDGTLNAKTAVSAAVGTTMRVENLFSTLPVRRKDFEKNARKDFIHTTRLLQAHAAVQTGIRMEAINSSGKSRTHVLGKNGTTGSKDLKRNLVELFGIQLSKVLVPLTSSFSFQSTHQRRTDATEVSLNGYLSDVTKLHGGQPDRQLTYINSRPCTLPQVTRAINEVYSNLGSNKNPFVFLDLKLPTDCYDVNVTPDKQTIYLHDEQKILEHLRETIFGMFSDESREMPVGTPISQPARDSLGLSARFSMNGVRDTQLFSQSLDTVKEGGSIDIEPECDGIDQGEQGEMSGTEEEDQLSDHEGARQLPGVTQEEVRGQGDDEPERRFQLSSLADTHGLNSTKNRSVKRKRSSTEPGPRQIRLDFRQIETSSDLRLTSSTRQSADSATESPVEDEDLTVDRTSDELIAPLLSTPPKRVQEEDVGDELEYSASPVKPLHRFVQRLNNLDHSSPSNQVHNLTRTMDFSAALTRQTQLPEQSYDDEPSIDLSHAGIDNDTQIAEQTLTLNVSKSDFFGMTVIGQFNLGFILVRRNNEIFIIDQHAADEKSNYEKLLRDTVIDSQKMARVKELELSAIEKISIDEHLQTLKKNGFDVAVQEDTSGEKRYFLTSLPVSRNITFDMRDLLEILSLLVDGSSPDSVRCTKAKRMFASRACRSSIMIGTALTKERMQGVVWHLGEMDAPWNCPHGRPTMRHLTNIQAMTRWCPDVE